MDTTTAILSKIVPKLEPQDLASSSPNPDPSSNPPPRTLALTPQNPVKNPRQPFPPNLHDEHRRILYFLNSLAPPRNPNPDPSSRRRPRCDAASLALALSPPNQSIKKQRKNPPRSGDLQRVSRIDPDDAVIIRDGVRRTRIVYEWIRARLRKNEESAPLVEGRRSRPDLNAGTLMRSADLWLNRDHRTIGLIPGVEIGDVFFYRLELCVVGLHGHVQAGIDFVAAAQSPTGEPIATSIVFSGGYEDDEDYGNVIIYTGHGGRDGKNETKHSAPQKLTGGNLALERSHQYGIEIRVIRGLDYVASPNGRLYVYDGLYRVNQWDKAVGKSGQDVYKFKLVRIAGQQEMGSSLLKRATQLKAGLAKGRKLKGYLCADISKGKEKFPVAVFNDVDEDCDPLTFDYMVRPVFRNFQMKELGESGCNCVYSCSAGCKCVKRNGGEFAYDDGDGRLLMGRSLVYECGNGCKCPSSCINRVSQKGLRHRLEVFRSRETGEWGVRSLDLIQAGEFVCEFSGILLTEEESVHAAQKGVRLVYPNNFRTEWGEWKDLSQVKEFAHEIPQFPPVPRVGYVLDVTKARNVASYVRHSSTPNIFGQYVLFSHYNERYPRLMLFALENILPMRELTLDYGV